jgi:hypothetical protein
VPSEDLLSGVLEVSLLPFEQKSIDVDLALRGVE